MWRRWLQIAERDPVVDRSTGVLQCFEPERSLTNPSFQLKMELPLAVLHRSSMRLIAVVSLLLWFGIVFAERRIAYTI